MEIWAYLAVWLGLGVLLLFYGIARGARGARLASGIFVLAAVLKIFLYDLSDLEGLMRALSFIGLGVVLIGIGLVYQKLEVFRNRPSWRLRWSARRRRRTDHFKVVARRLFGQTARPRQGQSQRTSRRGRLTIYNRGGLREAKKIIPVGLIDSGC